VHPSRRCNLHCLHCYSSSGPDERDELDIGLLCDALTDASIEGYSVVGCSGGEPLLYPRLHALLEHAHTLGMVTTVTSNGMLLDERHLATLQGAVDLLAISLDGVPASHNRMRDSERAFATMQARLAGVRRSGIPFGFIFTLTQHNLHELEWVVQFALEQGARLLQVHPLEEVGRARQRLAGGRPDEIESAYAYLEVLRLREMAGERLFVQLDLVDRELLRGEPNRVFAEAEPAAAPDGPLAELVSPLIVEPDGAVVPLQYGFARAYALGNLHAAPLRELADRWRRERYPAFRALCRRVFDELAAPANLPFTNWYEAVSRAAV
jgi:MoaA/NifB/PqqE/SkfB family radical SAM enzyme